MVGILLIVRLGQGATRLDRYYAHVAREDAFGVIAPWYPGQNGQIDERIRIAAEVMKRYPWVDTSKAVMAAPDFVYNSHWKIEPDGTIVIPPTNDWMCGDLSQRAWSIIKGLTAHYRYTGDPMAFVYIALTADYILDYGQTDAQHPWPEFPISTPTKGKAYGKCDPTGRNQLDLCAIIGTEILRAYKLTGNPRYLSAAKHWGNVFAAKCNFDPELPPWNRYVDPSVVGWSDELTGSTTLILEFLDDLIRMGHTGKDDIIVKARDAGRAYLTDQMLPQWLVNDTWGRNYWDWDNPVMCGITSMCGDYILKNRAVFPNWKTDLRNILSLIFNRNSVDPQSHGEVYNGAWAFPESSTCCGTSLSYNQYTAAPTFIRFGVIADDEWAREIGRRMIIMATYDSQENGVVSDGLFGQTVATGEWSNLAHPWPLCQLMEVLAWMPEQFGPGRENHIMRTTSVVNSVIYDKGRIRYTTYDAPAETQDVLRLAFRPDTIRADSHPLEIRSDLKANGYTLKRLSNSDYIVTIRHDGYTNIEVTGDDPQEVVENENLKYHGKWNVEACEHARGGTIHTTSVIGDSMTVCFRGNQVRLIGRVDPAGGRADIYLDDVKQKTRIDCWNPAPRHQQVLYYNGGLGEEEHELKIVCQEKNPLSKGNNLYVDALQFSAATGMSEFGQGSGPMGVQRMIFGYPKRKDYFDSHGNAWRPATEFVIRSGYGSDSVEKSWWQDRRSMYIGNTNDEELFRYGVHGKEFQVNLTVGPGSYYVKLMFADTPLHWFLERDKDGHRVLHTVSAEINGVKVMREVNISEAAGGMFRAISFTFPDIEPQHGIINIRLQGNNDGEAILQALEVGPYDG
ncbi:MAG: hypothetical protein JXD22_13535 [Sedimentisphaerales bacterium]|nr:hypothetical protein [Sedimentisphaerales bacterium]